MVCSFSENNGGKTDVQVFTGTSSTAIQTIAGSFPIDSGTDLIVGAERMGNGSFTSFWTGFVYNLYVYQSVHRNENSAHFNTGCSSGCWTNALTHWNDAGTERPCDVATCSQGCVNSNPCTRACHEDWPWCNLCEDQECVRCETYASCEVGHCGAVATNFSNFCRC
jgi:hypothetical protein